MIGVVIEASDGGFAGKEGEVEEEGEEDIDVSLSDERLVSKFI